jgi:multiple sugar transport system permease protein
MFMGLTKRDLQSYLFISPWIIGFLSFVAFPMGYAIYISMTNWRIEGGEWIGLTNYIRIASDPFFWKSLEVTVIYSLGSVPTSLVLGLAVALLLNQKIKAMALFRTVYYLPSVVSGVAVGLLWSWLFNTQFGVLNFILTSVGLPRVGWLTDPRWALPSLMVVHLWGIGGGMVIYLAGLQGIPTELYEAADIDGANGRSKFLNVTLPMISPVLLFNLVMGIIGSFQAFTNAYVLTGGGPKNATLVYMLYLYHQAWGGYFQGNMKMGYAAALAWILFFIILVLTLAVLRSSPMWVYYESLGGKRR